MYRQNFTPHDHTRNTGAWTMDAIDDLTAPYVRRHALPHRTLSVCLARCDVGNTHGARLTEPCAPSNCTLTIRIRLGARPHPSYPPACTRSTPPAVRLTAGCPCFRSLASASKRLAEVCSSSQWREGIASLDIGRRLRWRRARCGEARKEGAAARRRPTARVRRTSRGKRVAYRLAGRPKGRVGRRKGR